MKIIALENFDDAQLSPDLNRFNEPENWNIESGKLIISPEKIDFWGKTHYGFTYDNGHCLYRQTTGDFVLSTRVNFFPKHKYDQAGLMVRISKDFWLKTSVEYEYETLSRLGVVVTNFGFSDWSTQDFNPRIQEIELKVEKVGMDYIVVFGTEHGDWSQMRITHLHKETDPVLCGLYACCPVATGFRAEFQYMEIKQTS